jgi:hypothetical protein
MNIMFKGTDQESVRILETRPKAVPWMIEINFYVVRGLQV